jgi:hypothetical protein
MQNLQAVAFDIAEAISQKGGYQWHRSAGSGEEDARRRKDMRHKHMPKEMPIQLCEGSTRDSLCIIASSVKDGM